MAIEQQTRDVPVTEEQANVARQVVGCAVAPGEMTTDDSGVIADRDETTLRR